MVRGFDKEGLVLNGLPACRVFSKVTLSGEEGEDERPTNLTTEGNITKEKKERKRNEGEMPFGR